MHALRAKNMLKWQRGLRAYMLTCQRVLNAFRTHVFTCSCANVTCMFTCSRANVSCMLTGSCANEPCLLTCQRALHTYVLLGKTWENVQCILISKLHPDLSCFFIFTSFNTAPLILLVKIILTQNCKSVKGA